MPQSVQVPSLGEAEQQQGLEYPALKQPLDAQVLRERRDHLG